MTATLRYTEFPLNGEDAEEIQQFYSLQRDCSLLEGQNVLAITMGN